MSTTLELTKERKKKIGRIKEKAKLFVKLLDELGDEKTYRLYASGKAAIEKGSLGIAAEDLFSSLDLSGT